MDERAPRGFAAGVFLVALSTLVLEITLTRIFSFVFWYHFGALAISLAMFGLGASGVAVYLLPRTFARERMRTQLPVLSGLLALSIAVAFFFQLGIVFIPRPSIGAVATLSLLYAVTAVPFFLSGLCISLVFTHLPRQIGRLYFVDLLGAGLGCLLAVVAMSTTSAQNVVLFSAVLASCSCVCFSLAATPVRLARPAILVAALLALLVANVRADFLRFDYVKGLPYEEPDHEAWKPYAHVGVWGVEARRRPFGWGLSETWNGAPVRERRLRIDGGAGTTITAFDGDLSAVEHLKYDVTSISHHLLEDHKVLVIGAGGGRDVLAALAFGARSVHALEYNAAIVEAANEVFADFSGRVYELPGVTKVVAEGRSWVERSDERFDLIQASLVDSWAANASGAYVMAENFLYTQEAFTTFFEHLTEGGVLSISRFNLPQTPQLLRTVSIALEVLEQQGVARPAEHLMVVANASRSVGNVMVSRSPLPPEGVAAVEAVAGEMGFHVMLAPGRARANELGRLVQAPDRAALLAAHPLDLSPTTDDRPFFFHMADSPAGWAYIRDALARQGGSKNQAFDVKWYGTFVLIAVLAIATALAILCILGPLYTFRHGDLRGVHGKGAALGYFACLGVGFMLVEIPLMQRLTLFLGHPVYALSVVLFSLLVFAGLGSLWSSRWSAAPERLLARVLLTVLVAIGLYNLALPPLMAQFLALGQAARIAVTVLALLPLGLVLGMPLPLGMRLLETRAPRLIPWVWGVNGVTSVFASLFALVLAMTLGFTRTMAIGHACYALALVLVWTLRPRPSSQA